MNLKSGLVIVISILCLLGCAQEQVVVPGKREPISSVDSAAKPEDMSGFIKTGSKPVSYTHLTLPTNREV